MNDNIRGHEIVLQQLKTHERFEPNCTKEESTRLDEAIKLRLTEYCSKSSIHGLQYVGEENRSLLERLCWLVVVLLSLGFCGYQIQKLWDKWDKHPVLVSLAEESIPVWRVPFPAITICSETKAERSRVNFTQIHDKYKNNETLTADELSDLEKMSLVCDENTYTEGNMFVNRSIVNYFQEVGHDLTSMIFGVSAGRETEVSELFSSIITEEGICFTFNMLDAHDIFTEQYDNKGDVLNHGHLSPNWTLDKGYTKHAGIETYPRRALGAGGKAGVQIVLAAYEEDVDHECMGPIEGFKVMLHNPVDLPDVREKYFRVPLNKQVVVSVIPGMMSTSKGIKKYPPDRRQCYFTTERPLRFFRAYTENNCELECLSNFTLETCGCVAFYMPHDTSTPICGSGKLDCINDARYMLMVQEIRQSMEQDEDEADQYVGRCDCKQGCTVLYYDTENSQAEMNIQDYLPDASSFGFKFSVLTVFFKDSQFIPSRRNELYGNTDFLANCGGLLGLFMGFSVLSLVEIFYHLTLRVCCVYHSKKQKKHDTV